MAVSADGILESFIARLIGNFLIFILKNLHIILPSMAVTIPIYLWISTIYPDPPTAKKQVTLMGFSCQYNKTDNKHYCGYTFISDVNPPSQSCSIKDDTGKVFKEINFNKPSESKEKIPVDNPQEHIIFDCGKDFKVSIDVVDRPDDKLHKGVHAYNEGRYDEAFDIFKPLAKGGNAIAQNYIGHLYRYGHGVPQDYELAVKWYKKSADQENVFGLHNLAHRYQFGQGVEEDCEKAKELFKEGDGEAQKHSRDLDCEESLY